MKKVENIDDLVKIIASSSCKIIGIDGEDGMGKTTKITPHLESAFNAESFHVDDYLIKKNDSYVPSIKIKELERDIKKSKASVIIIEGVILLKILELLSLKADFYIYVSSLNWIEEWKEYGSYYEETLDEIIRHEVNLVNRVIQATEDKPRHYVMQGFRKEFFEYTYTYKPFDKADIVYISEGH